MMVQVLLLAFCLFGPDQEADRKQIITMQYHGRGETAAAKIVCLAAGSCILTLLFYGGMFFQARGYLKACDWGAPVQSLPEWSRCVWHVSCAQFTGLFLLYKIAALFLTGLLAGWMIVWLRGAGGMLLFGALLAGFYWLYRWLPERETLLWLKYANPAAWNDTWEWTHGYCNLSVFGRAVSVRTAFYVGCAVLTAAAVIGILLLFSRDSGRRLPGFIRRLLTVWSRGAAAAAAHTSILLHQLFQMFLAQKRLILFVGAAGVIFLTGMLRPRQEYSSIPKATYESYLNTVRGGYTNQTKDFLTAEQAHLTGEDQQQEKLLQQLEAGSITQEEYRTKAFAFQQEVQQKWEGFEKIMRQWELAEAVERSGTGKAGFCSEYLADEIFRERQRNSIVLALALLVSVLVSASFARMDASCEGIFLTALHGRGKRIHIRFAVTLLTVLLFGAGIYFVWYRSIFQAYPAEDLSISAACLDCLKEVPAWLSIRMAFLLSLIGKAAGLFCVTVLISVCAMGQMERTPYYCVITVFTLVPLLLWRIGVPVQWVSLMGCFGLEELLRTSVSGSLCYLAFWVCGSCVLYGAGSRRIRQTGEGIHRFTVGI